MTAEFERAAQKAKHNQEKRFEKERRELIQVERRAANAIQSLVQKQKSLEKQLISFNLNAEPRTIGKTSFPTTMELNTKKPLEYAVPPRKVSANNNEVLSVRRVKKVGKKKQNDAPPLHTINDNENNGRVNIPHFSDPATSIFKRHSEEQCEIVYADGVVNQDDIDNQSTILKPLEFFEHTPPYQTEQQILEMFIRNIGFEDYVTSLFLSIPVSEEEADLPQDWKEQSTLFGMRPADAKKKHRLKGRIFKLVELYNNYFEKMESIINE
ncbi:hypothetical protein HK100_005350 [Physocladia obscura]|uniref:Uncharacterized protein n=1 Tax=Physocladia obscura TaxID=109957 RepID=A0AAD5SXG1_9FUNG|nr:hypothetical protein HK100_005350 [Physocladia obscura]